MALTICGSNFYYPCMQKIISAAEMRIIDSRTTELLKLPSLLLMESAAAGALRLLTLHLSNLSKRRILIICGRGNNGGDGAALARLLWIAGAFVELLLIGKVDESKGDAQTNFEIVKKLATTSDQSKILYKEFSTESEWEEISKHLTGYDAIVDAIFGTGLSRPVEGVHRRVIEYILDCRNKREANSKHPLILSLDLPSGLDADKGEPIGPAIHADFTVTFTAPKPANVLPPASHLGGKLTVIDIGSPKELIDASSSELFLVERKDVQSWLRRTRYIPGSYKNSHGHAMIIAGSRNLSGAALLCGRAAMRSGAGLVTIATPHSAIQSITTRALQEIMTASLEETEEGAVSEEAFDQVSRLAERATVFAIGPGLTSQHESTRRLVRKVVENRSVPVVIDADGLNALAPWPSDLCGSKESPIILTPHQGEMLRLLGTKDKELLADRVKSVQEFAQRYHVILVLKGTCTLIAAPDGKVFINPTGNPGLGTAGTGDTLTGIITGFIAQAFALLKDKADALLATIAAVYVGGLAGDIAASRRGMRSMIASDISEHLADALIELDREGEIPQIRREET
jgi:ADP-dependent NAD(P)H-hydrate dehydratase / NAD(P)H-hydrate epimerase